jgi:hypothetical protein
MANSSTLSSQSRVAPRRQTPKAGGGIKIRQASFADYDQIASLQAANHLEFESREEWMHLWLENPAYKRCGGEWPIGWVLEAKDGKITGTISNLPRAYSFCGRDLTAAAGRGWAVYKDYRGYSLLLLGRLLSQPKVDLYLSTSAGGASAAACARLHWSRAPVGRWDTRGFWITNYGGFARSCLRIASVPAAKLLGCVIAPPMSVTDKLLRMSSRPLRGEFDLRFCGGFDDRFDGFWEELKAKKPHRLLAVRSRDVLNWQFKYAMMRDRLWILTACDGERLLGYGVFKRWDKPAFGLKRVRIIDFQSLTDDKRLSSAMLSCVLKRCRDERIHVLEDLGCWFESPSILDQPAPHHRNLTDWSYFYKTHDQVLGKALEEPSCWYPTSFDGDSSL